MVLQKKKIRLVTVREINEHCERAMSIHEQERVTTHTQPLGLRANGTLSCSKSWKQCVRLLVP